MSIDATQQQIISGVTEIVARELGISAEELDPTTDLRMIQGADSVKLLRMIAKIEREYDVELEDEDVFGVTCIDEITKIINGMRTGEHHWTNP